MALPTSRRGCARWQRAKHRTGVAHGAAEDFSPAPVDPFTHRVRYWFLAWLLLLLLAVSACSEPAIDEDAPDTLQGQELDDPPRRYSAEWLIDTGALEAEGMYSTVSSPFVYREVVDDLTGDYLVVAPNHLALQMPEEVLLCAAISRVPLDPYCASTPRAEGSPNVLSYPVQLIRGDWAPQGLYDLASYREVSLVAASDPDNWSVAKTNALRGYPIECFLVTGESSAASSGFEICFTDDDLHLVASVDLQNDLIFEIDLLRYERVAIADDFEIGFDDFIEERPALHQQLLDLYPEIPVARPTPTPG